MISLNRSVRALSYLLFSAVLLAGVSAPRLALAAPTSLVAAFDQPRVDSDPAVKTEARPEAKNESEDTSAFRHSPTVQWFSNVLHLDVETTAKAFEWINFAVIFLAVAIPLFKIMPKVLRKRSETLSHELQAARAATESANVRLSAVEAKLSGLDAEISAIRKQVEEDIREDEVRIKASIEEESARIVASAEQEIKIAAQQAQRGLKQYAADLAIDRAMGQLTLNADTDRALIAEFARDSQGDGRRRKKSAAGGQN